MLCFQMPAQAAFLGETAVTEDAGKLGWYITFVFFMTGQASFRIVLLVTRMTLKFAGDVADFTADSFAMANQGVLAGHALSANGAFVGFVGLRPAVEILRFKHRCPISRLIDRRINRHRRGRQMQWKETSVEMN